eukprot:TRINITY_DN3858_c0_g1_i13.p1 TRINITY_DN3858_c0_g1~~TRINITY_DN3858_c0_g1_i13.p1  ORF type:complete len:114 (+),score=43.74 TRINITY_DN3858_c0_g1_i13:81-422(+)
MDKRTEDFKKYLERSGAIENLAELSVAMFTDPERPSNDSSAFIKKYYKIDERRDSISKKDDPNMRNEYQRLTRENEQMRKELRKLELQRDKLLAVRVSNKIARRRQSLMRLKR